MGMASLKTREERKLLKWREKRESGRANPGQAAAETQDHLARGREERTL